jgi:uncharacterized protein
MDDALLRRGIELFNRQDFFECHEVLEEAWTPERGPRRLFLQSIIHMAVACYHCRRGNIRGARGQFAKGLRKLAAYLPLCEQIDTRRLYQDCAVLLEQVQDGELPVEYPRIETAGTPLGQAASNQR